MGLSKADLMRAMPELADYPVLLNNAVFKLSAENCGNCGLSTVMEEIREQLQRAKERDNSRKK